MRKIIFAVYSLALLSLGAFIQTNCSSATAQSSTPAASVTFDNTGTGLTSTNIQDAISEVATDEAQAIKQVTLSGVVGTWTFTKPFDSTGTNYGTLVLANDGTYTSTNLQGNSLEICAHSGQFLVTGNKLIFACASTDAPDVNVISLSVSDGATYFINDQGSQVLVGTKQ